MIMMIKSNELITTLIAIEIASIGIYIMILTSEEKRSLSAGLMYYLSSSIGSVIIIIGVMVVYIKTGETIPLKSREMSIIIIGMLIKIGAAPFHYWVPDVYSGLKTSNLLIVSTIGKIALIEYIRVIRSE